MAATPLKDLRRSPDDKVLGGVASGVAAAVGVDPVVIRLVFVLLTFSGGVGIVLYVLGWFLIPAGDGTSPTASLVLGGRQFEQAAGVGLMTLGVLLLLRHVGLFFPDQLVWPSALIGAGVVVAWANGGRPTFDSINGARTLWIRVAAGAALVAVGIGTFIAVGAGVVMGGRVLLAVAVTTIGLGVLAAPWITRLGRQLAAERLERIRQEERAEMAAHLHDSVLQTLALIQRKAESPAETISLARRQERELRAWLFGAERSSAASLASALQAVVDEVEADHPVVVDLVTVGDAPMSPDVAALVAATREAARNAATHSGARQVSVYAEIGDREITVFVRDRGIGFDPETVDAARRGIEESIVGRMRRHGGRVDITTAPGEGTEVSLVLPVLEREDHR